MNKELRVRMLAKTERNRIRRIAWKKFLRRNPDWERNTERSIIVGRKLAAYRSSSKPSPAVMGHSAQPSIFSNIKHQLKSIFRRKG